MKPILEVLEDRRLLAVPTISGGVVNVNLLLNTVDTVTTSIVGINTRVTINEGGAITNTDFATASVLAMVINTGGGNDTVNIGTISVPISIFGGNGHDTLTGGNGNDTIAGGNGDDSINGGGGNDRLDGGLNSDTLNGGLGSDTADYTGRLGAVTADLDGVEDDGEIGESDRIATDVESIMGGSGNDLLTGNTGGNYLSGGSGNDTLAGGDGIDILVGGSGVDAMYGNEGNDSIFALDGEIDVVDGGPGSDAAQTDPAEGAPVPGEDVAIAIEPVSEFVGPVYSQVFSTRQVAKRPTPASRRPTGGGTVSAGENLAPAGPAPGGPGGFGGDGAIEIERPILQSDIDQLGTFLAPYAFGQVIVTRRFQGQVTIGGTNGNDDVVIDRGSSLVLDIFVNGGQTRYFLPTPVLTLENKAGQDVLTVQGDNEFGATFEPSPQTPNQGTIRLGNGQVINYGQPGLLAPELRFSSLSHVRFVTPQAADMVQIVGVDPTNPNSETTSVFAYSGQFALPAVQLTLVGRLELDIATNEQQGAADDQIFVNNLPRKAPRLELISTRYPSVIGGGNDTLVVNGTLDFVNNPVDYPGVTPANLTIDVQQNSSIRFHAETTELASLKLATGAAATVIVGNNTLFLHDLEMAPGGATAAGAVLNLTDGNLIVDHDDSAGTFEFVRQQIFNAYDSNGDVHWTMPGITSTLAATNSSTGLGYASSAALLGPSGGDFRGSRVDGTATLVSYTLLGDTNLDRVVNFIDLVTLAQNYGGNPGAQHWIRGDFNYDRQTNFNDLVLLSQNYGRRLFT